MELCFTPIKTERIDYKVETRTLEAFLFEYISWKIWERSVIFLSSKIVSLFQKHVTKFANHEEKEYFAKNLGYGSWRRADQNYPLMVVGDGWILWYGWIDDSNVWGEESVLPPIDPFQAAYSTLQYLKQKSGIWELAIIITDSRSVILRKWSIWTAIAWAGCQPIRDYKWKTDLFWRTLLYTSQNSVDSLASTAVFLMWEGDESVPIIIMRWGDAILFTDNAPDKTELFLDRKDDVFCDAFISKIWDTTHK